MVVSVAVLISVLQVTDSMTGNKYAMKQLTRGDSSSFKKELTILKSLSHPNILRFVGVFSEKGCLSLITEFLDGGTLYSAICKLVSFEEFITKGYFKIMYRMYSSCWSL